MVRVRRHPQSCFARTSSEPSEHADRCRRRWPGCRTCAHHPCSLGPHQRPPCNSERCIAEDAKILLDRLSKDHCERAKDQYVPGLGIGRGGQGCAPPRNTRSQDHGKGLICARVCFLWARPPRRFAGTGTEIGCCGGGRSGPMRLPSSGRTRAPSASLLVPTAPWGHAGRSPRSPGANYACNPDRSCHMRLCQHS